MTKKPNRGHVLLMRNGDDGDSEAAGYAGRATVLTALPRTIRRRAGLLGNHKHPGRDEKRVNLRNPLLGARTTVTLGRSAILLRLSGMDRRPPSRWRATLCSWTDPFDA